MNYNILKKINLSKTNLNPKKIWIVYVLLAILIGIQKYTTGSYNNFIIFRQSVFHLLEHKNLYILYPKEYFDLFLYNPTFSVLFMPFAFLPFAISLVLWTVFVISVFFLSINSLPLSQSKKTFILCLIVPELITSCQNFQTNPLIAAFTVLSFVMLEKEKFKTASVFPSLNFFIKGYGAIVGVLFLLKKPQIKTFLYLAIMFVIVGGLPLLFYNFNEFEVLYQQWFWSLKQDYSVNTGISAMGFIKAVFSNEIPVWVIQLAGALLFLASFLYVLFTKKYEVVKYAYLANAMLFMIIFNQAAESATYIIASTGVFIWFVASKKTHVNTALFVLFYVLTIMSSTDLFPWVLKTNYVYPYSLKALPCLLIWLKIQHHLFTNKKLEIVY